MIKYIVRRLIQAIPVLIGVSLVTYGILRLAPGGPSARFNQNPRITEEQIDAFKHRWGLDDPIPLAYLKWIGVVGDAGPLNFLPGGTLNIAGLSIELPGGDNGIIHGDFGFSITDGRPVSTILGERILPTLDPRRHGVHHLGHDRVLRGRLRGRSKRYGLYRFDADHLQLRGLLDPNLLARPDAHYFPVRGGTVQVVPCRRNVGHALLFPIFGTNAYWAFLGVEPALRALTDLAAPSCPAGIHPRRWSAWPATRGSSGRACSIR